MGDYGKHQWKPGYDAACELCGLGVKDYAKPCTPPKPVAPVAEKSKADGKAT